MMETLDKVYFVLNEETELIELWVDGELITSCLSPEDEVLSLISQLSNHANIPTYKRASTNEILIFTKNNLDKK